MGDKQGKYGWRKSLKGEFGFLPSIPPIFPLSPSRKEYIMAKNTNFHKTTTKIPKIRSKTQRSVCTCPMCGKKTVNLRLSKEAMARMDEIIREKEAGWEGEKALCPKLAR